MDALRPSSPLPGTLPESTIVIPSKWNTFKDAARVSVSKAFLDFAISLKSENADTDLQVKSPILKSITLICSATISTLTAPLAVIEGVFRTVISLFTSLLSTLLPSKAESLDEFNKSYFDNTLCTNLLIARDATKTAFNTITSPCVNNALPLHEIVDQDPPQEDSETPTSLIPTLIQCKPTE